MVFRLLTHALAAAALAVASVVAVAHQSDNLTGAHEIPPFVLKRVELTAGAASGSPRVAGPADKQHRGISVQRRAAQQLPSR